ncbi:ParB N-terminal domain-containing protein [Methylobacillus sp.]|uniref:ParB/RepB/Spo0J family partition protein n=1 Tax=Methylobacillus sp. TaxID=56818 RepID=UPI0012BF3BFE|nr:ParB N-terminal domain-containing protein [Methylobacillus sp.]MPS48534.1 chromosome partitioning protein ParB [Methylobacillus sp.]
MTNRINIEYVPSDSLRANPWNSNVVSVENEDRIRESLRRFDMFKPILVRQVEGVDGYEVIGGHHRAKVAREEGHTELPILNLGYIDDNKAKEIGLVDNGRYGEDDPMLLAELLKSMETADLLPTFMPFELSEMDTILATDTSLLDELTVTEEEATAIEPLPEKPSQTHNILRFKVPVEDSPIVEQLINDTMKRHGYTDDDSMMNAGNALVHLFKELRK